MANSNIAATNTDRLARSASGDGREDLRVHGNVIEIESIRSGQAKFGEFVMIHEKDHQIFAAVGHTDSDSASCPSQNKHFFCGMAKKLGCSFCAKK